MDAFLMWTSLLVYLAVWYWVPRAVLGAELWFVGAVWAGVYVLFHVYEIVVRRHCYLSADSTAAPAVIVTALLTALFLHVLGVAPAGAHAWPYLQALALAFCGGHIAALVYSAAFSWLGTGMPGGPPSWGPWGESRTYEGLSRLSEIEKQVREKKRQEQAQAEREKS